MAQFLDPLCLISMFPLQEYKAVYTQIYVSLSHCKLDLWPLLGIYLIYILFLNSVFMFYILLHICFVG